MEFALDDALYGDYFRPPYIIFLSYINEKSGIFFSLRKPKVSLVLHKSSERFVFSHF